MKVIDIPISTPENVKKMKEDLKNFKESMGVIIEFYEIDAKVRKARYNSLVTEGFTPEQALEICKGDVR